MNSRINIAQSTKELESIAIDLTKLIQEAAYNSIPTKKRDNTYMNNTPWWDDELKLMQITIRNYRNLHTHERNPVMKQIRFQEYKKYRNKYVNTTYRKKQQSWKASLEEASSNDTGGNTYKLIKSKINPKSFSLPTLDNKSHHQHEQTTKTILETLFSDDTTNQNHTSISSGNSLEDQQITVTQELIKTFI